MEERKHHQQWHKSDQTIKGSHSSLNMDPCLEKSNNFNKILYLEWLEMNRCQSDTVSIHFLQRWITIPAMTRNWRFRNCLTVISPISTNASINPCLELRWRQCRLRSCHCYVDRCRWPSMSCPPVASVDKARVCGGYIQVIHSEIYIYMHYYYCYDYYHLFLLLYFYILCIYIYIYRYYIVVGLCSSIQWNPTVALYSDQIAQLYTYRTRKRHRLYRTGDTTFNGENKKNHSPMVASRRVTL